jgi:hypothetical protein
MRSWGAPGRGRWTSVEGGGAHLLGGLEHQAGAASGHPEPTDRGLGGCGTPARSYLCPHNTVNTVVPAQPSRRAANCGLSPGDEQAEDLLEGRGGQGGRSWRSGSTPENGRRRIRCVGAGFLLMVETRAWPRDCPTLLTVAEPCDSAGPATSTWDASSGHIQDLVAGADGGCRRDNQLRTAEFRAVRWGR